MLHSILITHATAQERLAKAEAIVENLSTPQGGLIAVEYRYLDAIGATKDSLRLAMEAFGKYGKLR